MTSLIVAASLMAVLPLASAKADRAPTTAERAKIESVLREAGFTRWGEIELDESDQKWEVDDAYARDGKRYELDLDAKTLKIIKQDPD
jgi:uncharacterized membrane protein YkoI